jgi:hypothetical protein
VSDLSLLLLKLWALGTAVGGVLLLLQISLFAAGQLARTARRRLVRDPVRSEGTTGRHQGQRPRRQQQRQQPQ